MVFLDKVSGLFVPKNRQVVFWQEMDYRAKKVYLKKITVDKVLNFVARSFSEGKYVFRKNNDRINDPWEYILNVRPNKNQTAGLFWKEAIYRLLFYNELLIVKTDDDQLLIADDFQREDWTVYPSVFYDVKVQDFVFERNFYMDEVIYVRYNNEKLSLLIDGLFDDYAEVVDSMLSGIKRNNQIRGVINIGKTGTFKNDESVERMQKQIEKMTRVFEDRQVAFAPMTGGLDFEETSNKGAQNHQPYDDVQKLLDTLLEEVAGLVGVPISLIQGSKADLKSNLKLYRQLCVGPLIKLIEGEMNAKIISKKEYNDSKRVVLTNILTPDVFDLAESGERLISSGVLTPNEVRELYGFEKSGDEKMDLHYITKNYTENLKGGGSENEED